ncbi:hypothetical protein ACH4UM_32265 [Streptomyces sp. NPDC020801]|uniref:hypothetical protein n=1 Tax=unclassified Streptomyces TaxID=2593676 RepID=UPI0037AD454E
MEQQVATEAPPRRPVGNAGVFYSFAPWIVFGVVASPSTWKYAALAALIAAIGLSARDIARGRLYILDMTAIVFFAVVTVLALALNRQQLIWLETYAQVISNGAVAVVAYASLLFDPFTAPYARQVTPPQFWGSPVFKHINVVLTTVWATVFAVMAVSTWLAVRAPTASDWLNWVVPVVLLVWAVKFTDRYPESYRSRVA